MPTFPPPRRLAAGFLFFVILLCIVLVSRSSDPHLPRIGGSARMPLNQPKRPLDLPSNGPNHANANPANPDLPYQNHAPVKANIDGAGGGVIMPKLGNETAKAELGRSAWHLFHTIMARFPDKPSPSESEALRDYVHLFVRLYPCGECAEHFRQIVEKFPPQVSSRSAAAVWACHVHNEVNKSLKKDIFDCSKIGDFYDCGCAEDEKDAMGEKAEGKGEEVRSIDGEQGWEKPEMSEERKRRLKDRGREFNLDLAMDNEPAVVLEKEP